ncbi:MAG: helix-turn-helix domain-containing protein [Caulobacteraceae bacterium]
MADTRLHLRDYPAATTMDRHEHRAATLTIVVQGGFVERLGRAERDYARGHAAFLPAGRAHAQAFGAVGTRQVTFEPQAEWIDYLADSRIALSEAPYANAPVYRHLGDRLLKELQAPDSFSRLACEGLMLEVVAAFGRRGWSEPAMAKPPAWLCTARDFIHANALEPLSLGQIARVAGRHEIHLARQFRRYFGASVSAYQRRLRIDHAAGLLRDTPLSLSEIALDCGFSSHAHLCREFKAQMGLTPSEYRRGGA